MKILAIRGMNLASLKGQFEIDFTAEPLASAGIFAITGPTGSGKSTLLDAIALALYAEMPRLVEASNRVEGGNGIKQDDPRIILRRGEGEAFAEVDFDAVDGKIYRSRWSVQHARGKVEGALQKERHFVAELRQGIEHPLPGTRKQLLAEVAGLVGLSFEQFRRTILLAQGDFAAFLRANEKEKTQLLEKITGTDIYRRISQRLYRKCGEVNGELDSLKEELAEVQLLSDEQVSGYQEQKVAFEKQLKKLATERDQAKQALAWYAEWLQRSEALKQAEAVKAKAEEAYLLGEPLRAEWARVKMVAPIAPIYKEQQKKRLERQQLLARQVQYRTELGQLRTGLQQLEQKLRKAKGLLAWEEGEWAAVQPKLQKAREIDAEMQQRQREVDRLDKLLQAQSRELLAKKQQQLEKELAEVVALEEREQMLRQSLSAELLRLREELKEGEPCPLCGSLHHPLSGVDAPIAEADEQQQATELLAKKRKEVAALQEEVTKLTLLAEQEEKYFSEKAEQLLQLSGLVISRLDYFFGKNVEEVEQTYQSNLKGLEKRVAQLQEEKSEKALEERTVTVRLEEGSAQLKQIMASLSETTRHTKPMLVSPGRALLPVSYAFFLP